MEFTTVQMNWFRRPSKVRFKKKENNVFRPCQKPKSQINISKKLKKNSPCQIVNFDNFSNLTKIGCS